MSIIIADILAVTTLVTGNWYKNNGERLHFREREVFENLAVTNITRQAYTSYDRSDNRIEIVTNEGFTVAYDKVNMNPAWVAYDLEPSEVIRMKRVPNDFKDDIRLPCTTNVQSFYSEFGGKYDRGQLAPAEDFNWNTNALKQTYLFSNIAPMLRQLNRGPWLDHEEEVRRLAESGTVHVVIFPMYEMCQQMFHRVVIPKSFVKVAWGWFGVKMWNETNEE